MVMGILGSTSRDTELVKRCIDKRRLGLLCTEEENEAGRRFAFGYYVFPNIERELEKVGLVKLPPIIWPERESFLDPEPSPGVSWRGLFNDEMGRAERLSPLFGDPSPQPNIPSVSLIDYRIQALKDTREAMVAAVEQIDNELSQLEGYQQPSKQQRGK